MKELLQLQIATKNEMVYNDWFSSVSRYPSATSNAQVHAHAHTSATHNYLSSWTMKLKDDIRQTSLI